MEVEGTQSCNQYMQSTNTQTRFLEQQNFSSSRSQLKKKKTRHEASWESRMVRRCFMQLVQILRGQTKERFIRDGVYWISLQHSSSSSSSPPSLLLLLLLPLPLPSCPVRWSHSINTSSASSTRHMDKVSSVPWSTPEELPGAVKQTIVSGGRRREAEERVEDAHRCRWTG